MVGRRGSCAGGGLARREHPFVVGLVQLEEGTRIVGNVVDVDPADVHVGLPVEVVFPRRDDGRPLPQWRPR